MKKKSISIEEDNTFDWESLFQKKKFGFIISKEQFRGILNDVNVRIDPENFLVDKNTKLRERSNSEEELCFDDLGVLSSGSKIFIKKNLASFSENIIEKRVRQEG